tara:strand:- start:66 stop:377 length:312 start_codon:yes stop_codon:yes gene_type:complete
MSKMDTQGMSPELTPEERKAWEESGKQKVYKPAVITPRRIITPELCRELKILINEVIDEREHNKKLKGPYDLYDEMDELGPSYFDTEHFRYLVGEEEPPYNGR